MTGEEEEEIKGCWLGAGGGKSSHCTEMKRIKEVRNAERSGGSSSNINRLMIMDPDWAA